MTRQHFVAGGESQPKEPEVTLPRPVLTKVEADEIIDTAVREHFVPVNDVIETPRLRPNDPPFEGSKKIRAAEQAQIVRENVAATPPNVSADERIRPSTQTLKNPTRPANPEKWYCQLYAHRDLPCALDGEDKQPEAEAGVRHHPGDYLKGRKSSYAAPGRLLLFCHSEGHLVELKPCVTTGMRLQPEERNSAWSKVQGHEWRDEQSTHPVLSKEASEETTLFRCINADHLKRPCGRLTWTQREINSNYFEPDGHVHIWALEDGEQVIDSTPWPELKPSHGATQPAIGTWVLVRAKVVEYVKNWGVKIQYPGDESSVIVHKQDIVGRPAVPKEPDHDCLVSLPNRVRVWRREESGWVDGTVGGDHKIYSWEELYNNYPNIEVLTKTELTWD